MKNLKQITLQSALLCCFSFMMIAKSTDELEIDRLKKLNHIDHLSIKSLLSDLRAEQQSLDLNFHKKSNDILKKSDGKKREILNTANKIVASKDQSFGLAIKEKRLPQPQRKAQSKKIEKQISNQDSVILSESKEILAKNPILDKIAAHHEAEIADMKNNHMTHSNDYTMLKKELIKLKQAQHLRDIQGTAIN